MDSGPGTLDVLRIDIYNKCSTVTIQIPSVLKEYTLPPGIDLSSVYVYNDNNQHVSHIVSQGNNNKASVLLNRNGEIVSSVGELLELNESYVKIKNEDGITGTAHFNPVDVNLIKSLPILNIYDTNPNIQHYFVQFTTYDLHYSVAYRLEMSDNKPDNKLSVYSIYTINNTGDINYRSANVRLYKSNMGSEPGVLDYNNMSLFKTDAYIPNGKLVLGIDFKTVDLPYALIHKYNINNNIASIELIFDTPFALRGPISIYNRHLFLGTTTLDQNMLNSRHIEISLGKSNISFESVISHKPYNENDGQLTASTSSYNPGKQYIETSIKISMINNEYEHADVRFLYTADKPIAKYIPNPSVRVGNVNEWVNQSTRSNDIQNVLIKLVHE